VAKAGAPTESKKAKTFKPAQPQIEAIFRLIGFASKLFGASQASSSSSPSPFALPFVTVLVNTLKPSILANPDYAIHVHDVNANQQSKKPASKSKKAPNKPSEGTPIGIPSLSLLGNS